MKVLLEHANITVKNLEASIKFITTAFPDFKVRHQGTNNGVRWAHVGTNDTYLALGEEAPNPRPTDTSYDTCGVNHLGYVVDDADEVRARLLKAGYKEGFVPPPHPHRKRVYIFDPEGMEWEFIQYLSDDPAKRHDYSL